MQGCTYCGEACRLAHPSDIGVREGGQEARRHGPLRDDGLRVGVGGRGHEDELHVRGRGREEDVLENGRH